MVPGITVLTRSGCGLCDEALPRVRRAARLAGFTVLVTDVDAAGLAGRYGEQVPVVLGPDGEPVAWGRLGTARLVWSLARLRVRI